MMILACIGVVAALVVGFVIDAREGRVVDERALRDPRLRNNWRIGAWCG